MEFSNYLPDSILSWLLDHGVKIVLILVGAYITHKSAHILIAKGIRRTVTTDRVISAEAEKKRQDTLITIFHEVAVVIIWLLAALKISNLSLLRVYTLITKKNLSFSQSLIYQK